MGYHIGLLIMAALYKLCPQFLYEHRLCWLRSPLYIVEYKGTTSYYYTDEEMDAARSHIKGEIHREKGLGGLSQQQARESMFSENQHLDIIEPTPEALQLLSQLMGKESDFRKNFIFENIDFSTIKE